MKQDLLAGFVLSILMAVGLAGCGGGGGGNIRPTPPGSPTTKECPDGSVVPVAEQCPTAPPRATGPLPGIERIPRSAIRARNQQLAEQWAILEIQSGRGSPNRHADLMVKISCESFGAGCDEGEPFTLIDGDHPDMHYTHAEFIFTELIPGTTKILSLSSGVGLDELRQMDRLQTSFALIQAAGNNPDENGVGHVNECHLRDCVADPEVAAALRDGRALFVAGYRIVGGEYVVDPSSVSCEGAEEYCLHAPFTFVLEDGERVPGTSAATPQVAAALGTVLALFPDTSRQNLIQLARVCAVSEPRLAGLGRADFTCMTVMDDSGEWRVVGVDDVISPVAMQSLRFPGQASMSGTFENANGGDVTLGLSTLGLFRFTTGVPVITEESVTGLFPVMAGDERNPTLGLG